MRLIYLMILLTLTVGDSPATTPCPDSCRMDLVNGYFEALVRISKAGTPEEINALLALCHEDVKYEHLEYEADFDRAAWHAAFTRNSERGVNNEPSNLQVKVLNHIHGKNHLAVAYAYGKVVDGVWHANENGSLMALFGFKDGKILLVREYW